MPETRTAMLIRCSREDAGRIRRQAAAEHRTVSGCILHILERSIWIENTYGMGMRPARFEADTSGFSRRERSKEKQATILLRCAREEAGRIRQAAARRRMSLSLFVLFSLRRHWQAAGAHEDAGRTQSGPS